MDPLDTKDTLEPIDPSDQPIDTLDMLEPVDTLDTLELKDPYVDRLAAIFYGGPWEDASEDAREYQRALIRTVLMGGHG